MRPPQVLLLGFAAVILAGAALLSLPAATSGGEPPDFLTSLFTATSAVCVTGLVVVDTGTYWSPFGQAVILLLMQVGGLGFMTAGTQFDLLLGKRIGLRERLIRREALNQIDLGGVVRLAKYVLLFTLVVESAAAAALTLRWAADFGWPAALWKGVFHAVSAFNNCGMDIMGNFRSMMDYAADPWVNFGITLPIILGGLGFAVVADVQAKRRWGRLSLHTKVVLLSTLALLVGAFLAILALEWSQTLRDLPLGGKLLAAYFQAVVPRTAGFNTVDIAALRPATQFLLIVLMFIGASPGSTGGGIKTTTVYLLMLVAWCQSRGRGGVEAFRRRIPQDQADRALTVFLMGLGLVCGVTMLLLISEGSDFLRTLFEATSAFGTVGLSMGLTPELSPWGRVIIIFTMYAGRLGPLTLAFALAERRRKVYVRHPEEKLMIG
ncbi:MAG: Trk family potassium uptake protein [Firmicutes bacterium]|nr:Trk family potassium uptake protein [Bacillota bacterium]